MQDKPIVVNRETGEVWEPGEWELVSQADLPDGHFIKLKIREGRADASNVQQWATVPIEEAFQPSVKMHPKFGVMVEFVPKEKFSMVFHSTPDFGGDATFKGYWLGLITHLAHNCNVVYYLDRNRVRWARSKDHLQVVCEATRTKFYHFYKLCMERRYLAEWKTGTKGPLYVVNPLYARNGNQIPIAILNLFEIGDFDEEVEI